jgi:hypothetical protein
MSKISPPPPDSASPTVKSTGKSTRTQRTWRPNLTSYRVYVQALTDKLNEDGLFKMSDTDAVKVAIEKAVKELLPDVAIIKKRKIYQRLNF